MKSDFSTKVTNLKNFFGCRVFYKGLLVVEGRCKTRGLIGATFRDLLRTIDKCGGDAFTKSARKRKFKEENPVVSCKHIWNRQRKSG